MLCLQKVEGKSYDPSLQPKQILLKPTVTRLGRSSEHSDVVMDSAMCPLMISRVHAEIHFNDGRFRINCQGLNGLLVNKTKRSSAVLCDGDLVVFGGAGAKTIEGQSLSAYDSELVYVFSEVCQNDSEEVGSFGEGTSDGSVRRRSKRKKPVSPSELQKYGYITESSSHEKKAKGSMEGKQVLEGDQKADPQEEVKMDKVDDSRSKKCLKALNEELLCYICRELMVLARTLPCSHTFCFGCIRDWLCHSKDCPNCRAKAQLKSAVPVKVLDNTINKVAEEVLPPEELGERHLKIQEMSKEAKKKTPKKVVPASSTSDNESDQGGSDSENYSEEESDYFDYSYGVEHARSGRAQCRTCGSLIPNRTLRWVVSFTDHGYRQYRQKHYHHLECYLPPDHVTFERLSIASDLSRADRRLVTERLRER